MDYYNSVGFLGFTVIHIHKDPHYVRAEDIRRSIIKKLNELSDDDLKQACELSDTFKCSTKNSLNHINRKT